MPATAPGTLTADETYSLVAWLLAKNQVITTDAVVDAETLPRIRMPARDRFVPDNRNGGAVVK
jgi:cytochrome c